MNCIPFWEPFPSDEELKTLCNCLWFAMLHKPERCAPLGSHPLEYSDEGEGGSG